MRLIGFLLVLAGLALAVGYPLYQSDFTGSEFHRERIFDRAVTGNTRDWKTVNIDLRENQNPLRIRLEGMRGDSDSYIGTNYPVSIDLTGPDGKVLSAALDMKLAADPDRPNPGELRLYINAPDFDVITSGPHSLQVTPNLERDISVLWMDAVFLQNVERPTSEFIRPGLIMAGFGAAMWFIGSRRSRKRRSRDEKAKPEPRRWGRG